MFIDMLPKLNAIYLIVIGVVFHSPCTLEKVKLRMNQANIMEYNYIKEKHINVFAVMHKLGGFAYIT